MYNNTESYTIGPISDDDCVSPADIIMMRQAVSILEHCITIVSPSSENRIKSERSSWSWKCAGNAKILAGNLPLRFGLSDTDPDNRILANVMVR